MMDVCSPRWSCSVLPCSLTLPGHTHQSVQGAVAVRLLLTQAAHTALVSMPGSSSGWAGTVEGVAALSRDWDEL